MLFFFLLCKLSFLIYHFNISGELFAKDWAGIIKHGFILDLSSAAFVLIFPAIILAITSFFNGKLAYYFTNFYTFIILLIISLLVAIDMEIYNLWGIHLDSSPLLYIDNVEEAYKEFSLWAIVRQTVIGIVIFIISFYLYVKASSSILKKARSSNWFTALIFATFAIALFLPIRDDWKTTLKPEKVYFHDNKFVNQASVNVVWNIYYSYQSGNIRRNPNAFFDEKKAQRVFKKLFKKETENEQLIKGKYPNIILLVLDNFTNKIIKKDAAKNIFNLKKEGIFFSKIYASNDVNDNGIISILSGYPSSSQNDIIKYQHKIEKLPFLNKELKKKGYYTAFYSGEGKENLKEFLKKSDFDYLVSNKNIDTTKLNSYSGIVFDSFIFNKLQKTTDTLKTPFFKVLQATSCRKPYKTEQKNKKQKSSLKNAIKYVDNSLGKFIEKAKKQTWWKNSLIIIVGNKRDKNQDKAPSYQPENYQIPMLWIGGAVAKKDTVINNIASQNDIAKTILKQLKLNTKDFKFSKNITDKNASSFAFYTFDNGFGFITDTTTQVHDNKGKTYLLKKGKHVNNALEQGRAYMQTVSEDFLKK